jgi:hypothetical protein
MTMTEMMIVTHEMAQTLVERHGRNAMVYVEDQVKGALKRADWLSVKAWRAVGSEIAKQLHIPG